MSWYVSEYGYGGGAAGAQARYVFNTETNSIGVVQLPCQFLSHPIFLQSAVRCCSHRSIYKYLDTGLLFPSVAICDPIKLTSPAQHASRWCMRASQTCRLLHRPRGLTRMCHRENRWDREFMLGNSRMKLPDAMERSVRRGRTLAAKGAPVVAAHQTLYPATFSLLTTFMFGVCIAEHFYGSRSMS